MLFQHVAALVVGATRRGGGPHSAGCTRLLDLPNALERLATVQESLNDERRAHRETKNQLQLSEKKLQSADADRKTTKTQLESANDWATKMAEFIRQQGIDPEPFR
jgi:septal ring factor EnvC (AmiA/AmiB activator)